MDIELILTHPKVYTTERWIRKHYPEEIAKVMATTGTKFTEKLYNYLYHNPVHICPVCGAPTKFRNFIYGYSTYCSVDCSHQSEDRVQRIKSSVKEKYGVDNYAKTPQWKEQRAKTCMERYGTKNFFNQDKIKQQYDGIGFGGTMVSKIKKTMMERYGTDCSMNIDNIKSKVTSAIKANQILKHDFLIGYTEDGDWICKCPHPECNQCEEKRYITTQGMRNDRIRIGAEACTRLLPKQAQFSTLEVKIRQWLDNWGIKYTTNDRRFG